VGRRREEKSRGCGYLQRKRGGEGNYHREKKRGWEDLLIEGGEKCAGVVLEGSESTEVAGDRQTTKDQKKITNI